MPKSIEKSVVRIQPDFSKLLDRISKGNPTGKVVVLARHEMRGGGSDKRELVSIKDVTYLNVLRARHFAATYQDALDAARLLGHSSSRSSPLASSSARRAFDLTYGPTLGWERLDELTSSFWCDATKDPWPHFFANQGETKCHFCDAVPQPP